MLSLYSTIKSKIQKFSNPPGKVTMHFVVLHVDVGKSYPSHSVVLYLRSSYCYLATIYHVRLSIEDSNIDEDHRNVKIFLEMETSVTISSTSESVSQYCFWLSV